MRLLLFDGSPQARGRFNPLAWSHPIWELRCGITTLAEKLHARLNPDDVACFVPEYMAEAYAQRTQWKVNDTAALASEDLLAVNARVKAASLDVTGTGPSEVGLAQDGEVLYARVAATDAGKLNRQDFEGFLESAKAALPAKTVLLPTYNYIWELILENPGQITADFQALGRSGIEGTVEQPTAIRGEGKNVYVGRGAVVHPVVVLDAEGGPIYLDEGVQVHPFTRIEGPCYVGRKSILLGTKCREGNSIGPVCRVGGEVEESVILGYTNKYHDGFLGHAYVGEWVNLGALTTNSDLKNDYSAVSVILDGRHPISTGSTKVGSLIGDHTKTSIGTLFNTGAYVGAMGLLMATGKVLPKFIPSFSCLLDGLVTKGFGKNSLYATAKVAMGRRNCQWTQADEKMWDAVYEMTAPARETAIRRARKTMFRA